MTTRTRYRREDRWDVSHGVLAGLGGRGGGPAGSVTVRSRGRHGERFWTDFARPHRKFIRKKDIGRECRKAVTPRKGHAARKTGSSVIEM